MSRLLIRKIEPKDNQTLKTIIKSVFHEINIPLKGTAYEDPETSNMYEAYSGPRSVYYVVEKDGKVLGGAGIKPLKGSFANICELQKMYGLPKMRGKGLGYKLLSNCFKSAIYYNFSKCYIETLPMLKDAIKLYKRNGFFSIPSPMGNTGHHNCNLWMLKDL